MMKRADTMAVLIAGPTASGKSRLALELAQERDGVVINADSMQVYRELRILTARPGAADEAAAPHGLYGHVPAAERYSVGAWLSDVGTALAAVREIGKLPIVVGGTGLYFKALTEGLSSIPPIPSEIRERIAWETAGRDATEIHGWLASADPEDAARIRPSDRARMVRALEVFAATGRPIADWRRTAGEPLVDPVTAERLVLEIDRSVLHRRIAARIGRMIGEGAIEEAEAIGSLRLPRDASAMKAIGVRELLAAVAGETSLDTAATLMAAQTRQYARRQETWFRNQMADWPRLPAQA